MFEVITKMFRKKQLSPRELLQKEIENKQGTFLEVSMRLPQINTSLIKEVSDDLDELRDHLLTIPWAEPEKIKKFDLADISARIKRADELIKKHNLDKDYIL